MKRASEADVYVFAGDFNATPQHYPPRFNIIQRHGYITDGADTDPTIYDANLEEADEMTPTCVKLDYIFAKGREKVQVRVQQLDLQKNGFGRVQQTIRPPASCGAGAVFLPNGKQKLMTAILHKDLNSMRLL